MAESTRILAAILLDKKLLACSVSREKYNNNKRPERPYPALRYSEKG